MRKQFFNATTMRKAERLLISALAKRPPGETSLSDSDLYPAFCELASRSRLIFKTFRRSATYQTILEHVSFEQGEHYLEQLHRRGSLTTDQIELLTTDRTGRPRLYEYGALGKVNPTTLRYLKVGADIEDLFGLLDSPTIGEIGVGYGGQCRVLQKIASPGTLVLYDLPEVLKLSKKFLESSSDIPMSNIVSVDGRNPVTVKTDLLISNYAFSELNRRLQEIYMEKVVAHASRGYFTYNHIESTQLKSMDAFEFASRIPKSEILPEVPLTHERNVVVVWGHK